MIGLTNPHQRASLVCADPFVAISDHVINLKRRDVQFNLTNTMRSIEEHRDIVRTEQLRKGSKRHQRSSPTGNRVDHSKPNVDSFAFCTSDFALCSLVQSFREILVEGEIDFTNDMFDPSAN